MYVPAMAKNRTNGIKKLLGIASSLAIYGTNGRFSTRRTLYLQIIEGILNEIEIKQIKTSKSMENKIVKDVFVGFG